MGERGGEEGGGGGGVEGGGVEGGGGRGRKWWKGRRKGEKWERCDIHFRIEESLDINVNKHKYSVYPFQYNRDTCTLKC